jgi:hypothetical protein
MLEQHDADVLPRCRRLGHEITFGYCRRETFGKPCRLIFDCWWESFDVRGFLQTHLPPDAMSGLVRSAVTPPPPKAQTLLDLIQQTNARSEPSGPAESPPPNTPGT